jgi:hypothetical protein
MLKFCIANTRIKSTVQTFRINLECDRLEIKKTQMDRTVTEQFKCLTAYESCDRSN